MQFQTNNLPHPTFWTGDFSLLDDESKPAVPEGVVLTPEEQANDTVGGLGEQFITIPSRLLNPTTQALIQNYFPKIGTGIPINSTSGRAIGFHTILPGNSVTDTGTLRVDHDFSDKDRVYVVYTASGATVANQPVIGGYTGLGLKQNERRTTRFLFLTIVHSARTSSTKPVADLTANTYIGIAIRLLTVSFRR